MAAQKSSQDETLFDISQHKMVCSQGDRSSLYSVKHCNGQIVATYRNALQPKRGSEVFIKKIPVDTLLQDVYEFALQAGDIYQIRILMEFSGYNRGFCFVTYFTEEAARKASLTLNGTMFNGNYLIVKISFDNNKLELRNVPIHLKVDQIYQRISAIMGKGLKDILTCKSEDKRCRTMNCILKYDTHRNALEARKKIYPSVKIWGNIIEIDWASPGDISQAKRLYFQNLPRDTTKTALYEDLIKYIKVDNMINIFLQRGLGYILFCTPALAFEGYTALKGKELLGVVPEYSFSRFYNQLADDLSSTEESTEAGCSDPEVVEEITSARKNETKAVTGGSAELIPYVPPTQQSARTYRHDPTFHGLNAYVNGHNSPCSCNCFYCSQARNPVYTPFLMQPGVNFQPIQCVPPIPALPPMNGFAQTANYNNLGYSQMFVPSASRQMSSLFYNNNEELTNRTATSTLNFNNFLTDGNYSGNRGLSENRNQNFPPVNVMALQPMLNSTVNDLKILQLPENYYQSNL